MDSITKIFVKRENALLEHGDYYIDPSVTKKITDDTGKESNIDKICKKYGIKNYTINEDGSIDVDGDVYLSNKRLTKLPLKFRNVAGDFFCDNNQLTTLEGCPTSVKDFHCYSNQLTTLEGCPTSVAGDFDCYSNQLTTLEGCPTSVAGDFACSSNKLTTLEGCPTSVAGDFYCDNIKELWDASSEAFKASHAKDAWAIKNNLTVSK